MKHLVSKTVLEENMFGFALPYADGDFMFFGGNESRFEVLCLQFEKIEAEDALEKQLNQDVERSYELPFSTGIVALISYDDYSQETGQKTSQFFQVYESVVYDKKKKTRYHFLEDGHEASFDEKIYESAYEEILNASSKMIDWQAYTDKDHYIKSVENILSQIKEGRFYQLNFLRYFFSKDKLSNLEWLRKLYHNAGPYGAFISYKSEKIVSFSPEKFFSAEVKDGICHFETHPIKGTSPRFDSKELDEKSKQFLKNSDKDHAELHMIVDLMRNDFFRICGPGNVSVKDPGTVYSFSNVHHLIASVTGKLDKKISLGECLKRLCPGGSITGAPKKEVMLAISELEKRPRAYFMGNILLFDYKQQKLDSSILIRTVHIKGSSDMEFAVGSGIVIASEAESEFSELKAKMRVVSNKS